MTSPARIMVAAASVALIAGVNFIGAANGPPALELWLRITGVVATIAAVQSVVWDRMDLRLALLLSTPPVVALAADASPTWLIGPLAAVLLVAGELNALSWELHGRKPLDAARRRRLLQIGGLGVLGVAAAALVAAAAVVPGPSGLAAVLMATVAFAALGGVLFAQR